MQPYEISSRTYAKKRYAHVIESKRSNDAQDLVDVHVGFIPHYYENISTVSECMRKEEFLIDLQDSIDFLRHGRGNPAKSMCHTREKLIEALAGCQMVPKIDQGLSRVEDFVDTLTLTLALEGKDGQLVRRKRGPVELLDQICNAYDFVCGGVSHGRQVRAQIFDIMCHNVPYGAQDLGLAGGR